MMTQSTTKCNPKVAYCPVTVHVRCEAGTVLCAELPFLDQDSFQVTTLPNDTDPLVVVRDKMCRSHEGDSRSRAARQARSRAPVETEVI